MNLYYYIGAIISASQFRMSIRIKCKALLFILILASAYYFFSRSEQLNAWFVSQSPSTPHKENEREKENDYSQDSVDILRRQKFSDGQWLQNGSRIPTESFETQRQNTFNDVTSSSTTQKPDNNFSFKNSRVSVQPQSIRHDETIENEAEKRKTNTPDGATSTKIPKYRTFPRANEKVRFATEISNLYTTQDSNQKLYINNDSNKNSPFKPMKESYLEYLESGDGEDDLSSEKTSASKRQKAEEKLHIESLYYTQPFKMESSGDDDDINELLSKVNMSDVNAHDFDLSKLTMSNQYNQDLSVAVPVIDNQKSSIAPKPRTNFAFVNQPKDDAKELQREKEIKTTVCNKNYDIANNKPQVNSKCVNYNTQLDTCEAGKKYFHNKNKKLAKISCKTKNEPTICKFTKNSSRTDKLSDMQLQCDQKLCVKRTIQIGIIDQSNGKFDYFSIENVTAIKKILSTKRSQGVEYERTDFVFLSCILSKNNKQIKQLLEFPPQIQLKDNELKSEVENKERNAKFDINIITIDSVSRPHFFRVLEKTVETMKDINTNAESSYEILDFTSFQSLAPFTFVNLQAFLSGVVDYESVANRRYFIENLFHYFKDQNYQTLFQEDTCWHDKWGSILTGNRILRTSLNRQNLWNEVQNLTNYYQVDSLGLTHMSCEVLKEYGTTNLFNTNKMVCFNEHPLSAYFIKHVENHMRMKSQIFDSKNVFSYTHINLGHERSGLKIKSLDDHLSNLIKTSDSLENNILVLWSDHGAKTTPYSIDSLTGRFEVYDPFLFIMVPKKLRHIVGETFYETLKENQNSLTNIIDVRHMLLHILKTTTNSADIPNNQEGLFSKSLKLRDDCSLFPARKYSLCKCINKLEFRDVSNKQNQDFLLWLGEYAIGLLNNKLTNQQTSTINKCVRLIGTAFENIISKPTQKGGILWIFDVLIPFRNKRERFNFQILFNKKQELDINTLVMEKYQRVSIYSRYSKCKDATVHDDLCICAKNIKLHITLANLERYQQFNLLNIIKPIHNSTCLYLLTRDHGNVVAMEVANLCFNDIEISFTTDVLTSWEISEDLPITRMVKSNKIIFIASFIKVLNYQEDIKPSIDINIVKRFN